MHEGDGDGQYPVPLEKRSQAVETAVGIDNMRVQEDAEDRSKTSKRERG